MKKLLIPIVLSLGFSAQAGGFRVSLQGVKQLAMAHTSAHTEDASIAFFNPAGISFIPNKLSITVGGFGAFSEYTYQDPATLYSASTDNPVSTPIYAAIAYKVTPDVSVGFSFATPFGSSLKWGEEWEGKEMVQTMKLKALLFQPMISVKLADWMSVGGSYIYTKGTVDWDRAITKLNGTMNIDGVATGHGFGLGFYFRPNEKLDISVAYRSPIDVKEKSGTATFNISPALYSAIGLNTADGTDKFSAIVPLTDEYTIGATYQITPKWKVSADFNYYGWSTYNALTLDFENALVGNQTDRTVATAPKNFKNSFSLRFGTQYMITENIAGRLGYYFDESPYDDENYIPDTPSHNNNAITAGFGFKLNKFNIDIAGGYALLQKRNVNNHNYNFYGQAKAKGAFLGLGLSYNPF